MATARDMLQEVVAGLTEDEAARALELIRCLRVGPEDIEWIKALATNPDVSPPRVPADQRTLMEPIKIEGPPLSEQLIEERR